MKKNNLNDKVKELEENQILMIEQANGKYKCKCNSQRFENTEENAQVLFLCDDVFDAARELNIHKFTLHKNRKSDEKIIFNVHQ